MSTELAILFNHLIFCHPFLFSLLFLPTSRSFPMSYLFPSTGQSIGASASLSVLPVNIQGWFPLGLLVGIPCCPRDSQESSPAPSFKSIDPWVLSLPAGPALCDIHHCCCFFVVFASSAIRLCRQGPCLSFSTSSPGPAHRKYLTSILFIEAGTSKRKKVWVLREQNLNHFDWLLLNSQTQASEYILLKRMIH